MKHLIVCPEYPPAPSGGIGTYVSHWARLLAFAGETVHVIGRQWAGAERPVEESVRGRLIVHRLADEDWNWWRRGQLRSGKTGWETSVLFHSDYPPQAFAWQAALLTERLIQEEGIDQIEGQEYQAPLYYYLLRRSLGLGPAAQPPCLVHLHSPTEFIARHNHWNQSDHFLRTARQLEEYVIRNADALLCPSAALARQGEERYGLSHGSIPVIPLPLGDSRHVEREPKVWKEGTVLYAGRLEPRKGVFEWLDAAIATAGHEPDVQFVFAGDDTLDADGRGVEEQLRRRIPRDLASPFVFLGPQDRSRLYESYAKARLAAVPSRWENLPYSCVEAMASGLPVIVTAEGGMAEMIENGESGWIASAATAEGLRQALARALDTTPDRLAEMGENASQRIRAFCDNNTVLEQRLELARRMGRCNGADAVHFAAPNAKNQVAGEPAPRDSAPRGLAFLADARRMTRRTVESIAAQSQPGSALILLTNGDLGRQSPGYKLTRTSRLDVRVLEQKSVPSPELLLQTIRAAGIEPLGLVWLDGHEQLSPDFAGTCLSALERLPDVGVISFWTRSGLPARRIRTEPPPAFPYQWVTNQAVPCSAIRASAFAGSVPQANDFDLRSHLTRVNSILAAGWKGVTVPLLLATNAAPRKQAADASILQEAEIHYPTLLARDRAEIAILQAPPRSPYARHGLDFARVGQVMRRAVRKAHPHAAAFRVSPARVSNKEPA